jgi:hypothetical protein
MSDATHDREDRLQRYLDLKLSPQESARFEAEILGSPELSEEVVDELSLRELIQARRHGTQRRPRAKRFRPRRWGIPAAVAAAAVLLLVVWPREDSTEGPVFRGDDSNAIVAIEPMGALAEAPTRFAWEPVEGASSYRLEIFNADGERVRVETMLGTSFEIEPGDPLPSSGYWQLTPIDDLGMAGARSQPFHFRSGP